MKITTKQLRQIIKEEMEEYTADQSQNPIHGEIFKKILELADLIEEHGSHPNFTDAYIALLRAAQKGGLNLKNLMMML